MGLDMYLTQEVFIGGNYGHRNVTGEVNIKVDGKQQHIPLNKLGTIILKVGYWRKVNAVHNWFVENVQDGVDECQKSYVSYEQLQELRQECVNTVQILSNCPKESTTVKDWQGEEYEHVIYNVEDVDTSITPISGFFFGSTDIDNYFVQDLVDTITLLTNLEDNGMYYYQASW